MKNKQKNLDISRLVFVLAPGIESQYYNNCSLRRKILNEKQHKNVDNFLKF